MSPHRRANLAYQAISNYEGDDLHNDTNTVIVTSRQRSRSETREFLAYHASEAQNFTVRGIMVGLGVGLIICFSNMYFGLQTGWVSSMGMPASLMGFAFFKTFWSRHLDLPFTEVENVLIQTVAGSMGVMPLGCGFLTVMPALNYMLKPEEQGPVVLSLWESILWSLGLCYVGVFFAVLLRHQVIIRENLKFPSGTATALMIGVLHGQEKLSHEQSDTLSPMNETFLAASQLNEAENLGSGEGSSTWKAKVRLLAASFVASAVFTLVAYFLPVLHNLPIFGWSIAENWLWTLNPSLAYVGQGIIMGPETTLHILLGAVVGWGIISPLAKHRGWAPGPIDDWEVGSKGWLVWISLAIMLSDSVISLGFITVRPILTYGRPYIESAYRKTKSGYWKLSSQSGILGASGGYRMISGGESTTSPSASASRSIEVGLSQEPPDEETDDLPYIDVPPEYLVSNRVICLGIPLSIIFCIIAVTITFGASVPFYAIVIAIFIALLLSIIGVRALGETDMNPVTGISKISQLFFALIVPQSNKNSMIINLVAGAVSEAAALQSGDLMQDLKTGHLHGAAPNAQFLGQLIGSTVGSVVSALIYKLYTNVYTVPGDQFPVPAGQLSILAARLVTGKGLPPMAWQWALGAALVFSVTTGVRIVGTGKVWHPYIPGGIAVAVGMYNVPSFTLARAIGGVCSWYWRSYRGREETPIIIIASGLILGEGLLSMATLLMESLHVSHL